MSRVLGIDPGVSETGWAVLEPGDGGPRLVDSGCLKTSPRTPLAERLRIIHQALSAILKDHAPASVAVEEMFFVQIAHTVRATLQARGVVLLAAAQAGLEVREYNPRQVKMAITGSGSAAKAQMQRMTQVALKLAEPMRPDDTADAAAIALCHMRAGRIRGLRVLDRVGGRK
ncbi:MAG: crossover junction endodeoxyribonuclease RuvC [Elusimicrobia bacterium]|nr:crossover junction endodeoxyribonuclease RuvC [Elusimicrobiota bacterium]